MSKGADADAGTVVCVCPGLWAAMCVAWLPWDLVPQGAAYLHIPAEGGVGAKQDLALLVGAVVHARELGGQAQGVLAPGVRDQQAGADFRPGVTGGRHLQRADHMGPHRAAVERTRGLAVCRAWRPWVRVRVPEQPASTLP